MYSVVLMMALTSGGDVPALGHGCCGGCYGCYGCYGGCHGCHGCRGGHFRGHGCHGCYGCCGGCYGCCGGCYGGCYGYGCCGGHKHHRRHGCGGGCYGCYGGYGGCYGGCFGGVGAPIAPGVVVPAQPAAPKTKKTSQDDTTAPATLIVAVPADARLSIDGEATTSTATERVFVSPELKFGREYHYTLEAEFRQDGKNVKVRKEVAVKAGEATSVRFDASPAEVAAR